MAAKNSKRDDMSCLPRETSPRSFHSAILLPQVAHGRGGLLRCATTPVRRPGVIHDVTPPGSVLNQRNNDTMSDHTNATTTRCQTIPTPQRHDVRPYQRHNNTMSDNTNTTTTRCQTIPTPQRHDVRPYQPDIRSKARPHGTERPGGIERGEWKDLGEVSRGKLD